MKRFVLAALALAMVVPAIAVPALADPTVTVKVTPGTGTMVIPTTTIYGRPNRPMVQIEIRPVSAAAAAGAAHEQLRQTTLLQSQPATLTAR